MFEITCSLAMSICNDRYDIITEFKHLFMYIYIIIILYRYCYNIIVCLFPQEDLLIHGDSVYDMIDKQDHQAVQTELSRSQTSAEDQGCKRMFLCRMNVSRNARRQMRFGDQKVYIKYNILCYYNNIIIQRVQFFFFF